MISRFASPPVVPVLETERLRMRGPTLGDAASSEALWTDPAVTRFIGGLASTSEECWLRLVRSIGHWAALGFGTWAVEEKSTGRFVGEVGLFDFHRLIDPPLPAPEVGWVLAPWAHGRGFATEAVNAALAWSDAELGAPEVACIIDPDNLASIRVAEKCGFRLVRETIYRDRPILQFARPAAGGA